MYVMKSIFDGWGRYIWLPVFNLQYWGLKQMFAAFQETTITTVDFGRTMKWNYNAITLSNCGLLCIGLVALIFT